MAPAKTEGVVAPPQAQGPHPSYIQVARPFIFHQQIQGLLLTNRVNMANEDQNRLQGVQWINDVRNALQLPVKTFATAVSYYHRFRLAHKDGEFAYQDAAFAALFTACKIEDTLKKSREILCAAHNLKAPAQEHLNPDDITFELPSKTVIGYERLVLESSKFDFRARYPHKHLFKMGKYFGLTPGRMRLAYNVMLDMYKTFAPLKQTCSTMSYACIELATLLENPADTQIFGASSELPTTWKLSRGEVVETMLDILDLYTHSQKASIVGPTFDLNHFIQLQIRLNKELEEKGLTRYTEDRAIKSNGLKNIKTPKTPITPASPTEARTNGGNIASPATLSPRSSSSNRRGIGARGQEGTVRFMLDAENAKQEKATVAEYLKEEYEEYEVEVEEPIRQEKPHHNHNNHHPHPSRSDRFHGGHRGYRYR